MMSSFSCGSPLNYTSGANVIFIFRNQIVIFHQPSAFSAVLKNRQSRFLGNRIMLDQTTGPGSDTSHRICMICPNIRMQLKLLVTRIRCYLATSCTTHYGGKKNQGSKLNLQTEMFNSAVW